MKTILAAGVLIFGATAWSVGAQADDYTILDSVGATKTIHAKNVGAGVLAPQSIPTGADGTACVVTQGTATTCGVVQGPLGVTNTQVNGTVATTNAWQAALAASVNRKGCLLQNQSIGNVMYIFFGASPPSNGVVNTAFQLNPGLSVSCATATGGVSTDLISITGTSGDNFVLTSE